MTTSLKFVNRTAEEDHEITLADKRDIEPIMDWYGAFYAGDDYDTLIDGKIVPMGINGEFQHPTIDAVPNRLQIDG